MVQKKYSTAEAMYAKIKEEVCQRALALDEAVSQSTQVRSWGAKQPSPLRVYCSPLGKPRALKCSFIPMLGL